MQNNIKEINNLLNVLTKKEREYVILLYGLEDGVVKNLDKTADILGVTRERVRQYINNSTRKMIREVNRKRKFDYEFIGITKEQGVIAGHCSLMAHLEEYSKRENAPKPKISRFQENNKLTIIKENPSSSVERV